MDGSPTARVGAEPKGINKEKALEFLLATSVSSYGEFVGHGRTTQLNIAINCIKLAIGLMDQSHRYYVPCLNDLGCFLGSRYHRTGEAEDLEEALRAIRAATQSIPHDHPFHAGCLNNLGRFLSSRYERYRMERDLEEAIRVAREAIQPTSHDHAEILGWKINLSSWLGKRYERTKAKADLEEAIKIAREAAQLTQSDRLRRAGCLNDLGILLGSLYQRTGKMQDLEEAVTTAREAVQLTPSDDPNRALCLNNLSARLCDRYEQARTMKDLVQSERNKAWEDLEEIALHLLNSFDCVSVSPFHRIQSVYACLPVLVVLDRAGQGIELGGRALDLLLAMHTRSLDRIDAQFVLSDSEGIASGLCALLLSESRVNEAVERLEQGRAIIIRRLLDDRSDVSSLLKDSPRLAQRYQTLLNEINLP